MTRARKTYPPEFKAEAVRLVREDGMWVARLASSLGVDRTLVREWVKKADEAALAGTPAATTVASMADELARLRVERKGAQARVRGARSRSEARAPRLGTHRFGGNCPIACWTIARAPQSGTAPSR